MTYWKSLKIKDGKIISDYDKSEWKIGVWRTVCEPTELCKGLNCSEMILDTIGFVKPDVIAEVEIFGKCLKGTDKYTCERMRILRAWITPPKLYAEMAIFAAYQVLKYYEAKYPDDKRPREAIEKAQVCIDAIGTENAASAAASASYAAASAASDAAYVASASKTDKEKARSEMRQKIEQWLIDHITVLPEMQT